VREGLHIALVKRDPNRSFALDRFSEAVAKVMSVRAHAGDALVYV